MKLSYPMPAAQSIAAAGAGAPLITSEVGRLRSVLLHRPGDELRAVEPANAASMLFAGPVDVEAAQAEHDAFAFTLRARGVEVLYLEDLLAEIAVDQPRLSHAPLPNLMFVRDPSAWIGRGVAVGTMATDVRARERSLFDALYRLHPRFARSPTWTDMLPVPTRVEGGDVLVVDERRVMVGISPRTPASGCYRLTTALLTAGAATEVLTVALPGGAGFHLDLVVAMVDRETFAVWAPVRRTLRAHRWRATSTGVEVRAVPDPFSWLSASSRVIEIGSLHDEEHGRRWDHGVNVLAVAPGVVVAYADNHRANAQLDAAGVQVLPISGAQLARGRGGPRCLSCPLVRNPAW